MTSPPLPSPTLLMLAGPNGSGKTSFYETVLQGRFRAPFINADLIQRDHLRNASMEAAYEAARIAQEMRREHILAKRSFISESTFSHPSKLKLLDEAKAAGFRVVVYHLNVRDPKLSVARVACRVQEGGHNVPPDKIRERYFRSPTLIKRAVLMADYAFVYDNSALNQPPQLVMSFQNGRIKKTAARIPRWVRTLYAQPLSIYAISKKAR